MTTFTDREIEVLVAAFKSMKEDPKVDFDQLALLTGYQSSKAARNSYRAVRQKLDAAGDKTTLSGKKGIGIKKDRPQPPPRKRARPAKNKSAAKLIEALEPSIEPEPTQAELAQTEPVI